MCDRVGLNGHRAHRTTSPIACCPDVAGRTASLDGRGVAHTGPDDGFVPRAVGAAAVNSDGVRARISRCGRDMVMRSETS